MATVAGAARPAVGGGPMGRRKKKRYPVPVSLTLRNLFVPPQSFEDGRSDSSSGKVRAVASADAAPRQLLFRSRLEIVADSSSAAVDEASALRASQSSFVGGGIQPSFSYDSAAPTAPAEKGEREEGGVGPVFSSEHDTVSLHPQWDHLDERVDLFDRNRADIDEGGGEGGGEAEGDWDGLYRTLRARIVVDRPAPPVDKGEAADRGPSEPILLADVPLHPTLLKRLPRASDASSAAESDAPPSLPPNAVLLRHSDGASRVLPALHRLLLDRGVVSRDDPRTLDDDAKEELEEERRRERRFDDDIFAVLDAAGAAKKKMTKEKEAPGASPSHLLGERRGGPPAVGGMAPTTTVGGGMATARRTSANRKAAVGDAAAAAASAFSDDSLFDLLGGGGSGGSGGSGFGAASSSSKQLSWGGYQGTVVTDFSPQEKKVEEEAVVSAVDVNVAPRLESLTVKKQEGATVSAQEETTKEPKEDQDKNNPQDALPLEEEVRTANLNAEVERLRLLLREEEEGLLQEQTLLKLEVEELTSIVTDTKRIEAEAALAKQDAEEEAVKLARSEFALEVRRIKLLRDLRSIYPIRRFPHNVYTIRDVHLPSDLHSLNASDALISAALGFACHLVFMAAKYLAVPLRYRLICNSSRSAVQDDGRGVCPLFKERGVVEREQFDRAVELLARDVECLLRTRGVRYDPRSHLLAKVDRLFEATTECSTTAQ